MPRPALIAGASGLVGGHCLRELLESADYDRIFALVRKPLPIKGAKLMEIIADVEHFPELPPLPGAAVFCALGTTIAKAGSQAAFRRIDYEYPLQLAERALRAGAKDFALVSSIGADAASGTFYLRVKGELEKAIGALPYRSLHIFQPSLLLGDRTESRPAERIGIVVARAIKFLFVGRLAQYRPVAAKDVARAMVRSIALGRGGLHTYRWREIESLAAQASRPGHYV